MKMVKSLLLGSAAGVVAVAGAQAADLPVKAEPVQYVKICTLYGDGFYYIPGSDTCIRFSGYIRADYGCNVTGARTPHYSGAAGAQDRTVSRYSTRHRGSFTVDTRTQTAYGTLRTFQTSTSRTRTRPSRPTSPARSSSGAASPSAGRCRSPTTKAASAMPACALCIRRRTRATRRQRHQPDRLHLAAGQRHHLERRRRRASREVDRQPVGDRPARARSAPIRRRPGTAATIPNPWVALRVNQAWGRASIAGIVNHNAGDLLHQNPAAPDRPAARRPAPRCAAIRATSGAGRSSRRRDQARLAEPGQPGRLLRQLRRRRHGLQRRQQPGEPGPVRLRQRKWPGA